MDINHIKLPASVIADLYHSSLIETDETPVKQQAEDIAEDKLSRAYPVWK